ncbi:MAG: ABC transporter ATP-binding protein [Thermoleophilia bacterium]|nr:ABC transporter ATP-binding protein [Thermoleophilia bacterium]
MDAVHVELGHDLRAFRLDVALTVGRETVALVGPSGAGKTTVVRAVAGLLRPRSGLVEAAGETWLDTERGVDVPPERRSVGLVFQDYALFPHLSVAQNVCFGAQRPVEPLLEHLGLAQLARARPGDLSGGERQRVALARALAREPRVLLLDEPLAALDTQTRATVRGELRMRLRETGLPTVLVTHDFNDAAALADRLAVVVAGRIVQQGTAAELVAAPASPFVASFAGGNVLPGRARSSGGLTEVMLHDGTRVLSTDGAYGEVAAVVYPWDVALARDAPDDSMQNHLHGEVTSVVPLGNRLRVRVGTLTAEITAASGERLAVRDGDRLVASFKASATRLLPLGGGGFANDSHG